MFSAGKSILASILIMMLNWLIWQNSCIYAGKIKQKHNECADFKRQDGFAHDEEDASFSRVQVLDSKCSFQWFQDHVLSSPTEAP